jgi:hypothetical protein
VDAADDPLDAAHDSVDVGPDDGDPICPGAETRPRPAIIHRFEDGSPEVELQLGRYRVIAPEGHEALIQHALDVLPSCYQAIEALMGHCNPWGESVVHYGRNSVSKGKVDRGVVYIGRTEVALTHLDDASAWAGQPSLCGSQNTLSHEAVHTFQPESLPAWLKEGWAEYFSKIIVSGYTYECSDRSLCRVPPSIGGRPPPEDCPNPIEYWDLSDPDWAGERPGEGEEGRDSNKSRYYDTGTCFWQSLMEAYGEEQLRLVFQKMHLEPRDDLPNFPFSAEINDRLMRVYFVPVLGESVWPLVARYGVTPIDGP